MELITNILIEYLKHNKRIVVPKLGAFIVKQQSGIVRFSDLMRNDDGVLRSLLVAYGMSELEANGKIDRFVFEIRHAIGQNQSVTLKEFGEFRAGENNTITFIHKLEPRVIGGNIKPPVEILNVEKQKLQHIISQTKAKDDKTPKPEKKQKTKDKTIEENTVTLSKPDSYLRGLNYDDRKKRSEERNDKRRAPKRVSPLAILLIFMIIIGGTYGGWRLYSNKTNKGNNKHKHQVVEDVAPVVVDTLMMALPADSLQVAPIDRVDSLDIVINNTVTE